MIRLVSRLAVAAAVGLAPSACSERDYELEPGATETDGCGHEGQEAGESGEDTGETGDTDCEMQGDDDTQESSKAAPAEQTPRKRAKNQ